MKISLITATWNSESSIRPTVNSINKQQQVDIEFIVVDKESTDATIKIIKENSVNRPLIICEQDSGIYEALNKGIKKASGDIIGFLHSGDVLMDENTLQLIESQFGCSSVDGVYGDIVFHDESGRILRQWKETTSFKSIKCGWAPPHTSLFLRKSLYDRFGLFDTAFRISGDYEFMVRILKQADVRLCYIPKVLVSMSTGGISTKKDLRLFVLKLKEDLKAVKLNKLPFPYFSILMKRLRKIKQFLKR